MLSLTPTRERVGFRSLRVNKVGTRALATVAAREKVDCLAVAASDKVAPGTDADREERDPAELYDGDAAVSVANPTFDVTPLGLFDAVVTERRVLDGAAVRELAQAHRERRARLD
jgi:translation initiation factor 2B subunit (eIF-2B alpha/beta/delta family)